MLRNIVQLSSQHQELIKPWWRLTTLHGPRQNAALSNTAANIYLKREKMYQMYLFVFMFPFSRNTKNADKKTLKIAIYLDLLI